MYPTLDDLSTLLAGHRDGARFVSRLQEIWLPDTDPSLGPCLVYTRAKESTGYGVFVALDPYGVMKNQSAHKWLYQQFNPPVPAGYELDHVCHDHDICKPPIPKLCPHRACVVHVELKTVRENRLRSNSVPGRNARKTHCNGKWSPRDPETGEVIGHDWNDPANVRRWQDAQGYWHIKCLGCEAEKRKSKGQLVAG